MATPTPKQAGTPGAVQQRQTIDVVSGPTIKTKNVCDITVTVSETVQLRQYEPFRVEVTVTRKDVDADRQSEITTFLSSSIANDIAVALHERQVRENG